MEAAVAQLSEQSAQADMTKYLQVNPASDSALQPDKHIYDIVSQMDDSPDKHGCSMKLNFTSPDHFIHKVPVFRVAAPTTLKLGPDGWDVRKEFNLQVVAVEHPETHRIDLLTTSLRKIHKGELLWFGFENNNGPLFLQGLKEFLKADNLAEIVYGEFPTMEVLAAPSWDGKMLKELGLRGYGIDVFGVRPRGCPKTSTLYFPGPDTKLRMMQDWLLVSPRGLRHFLEWHKSKEPTDLNPGNILGYRDVTQIVRCEQ